MVRNTAVVAMPKKRRRKGRGRINKAKLLKHNNA